MIANVLDYTVLFMMIIAMSFISTNGYAQTGREIKQEFNKIQNERNRYDNAIIAISNACFDIATKENSSDLYHSSSPEYLAGLKLCTEYHKIEIKYLQMLMNETKGLRTEIIGGIY